MSNNGSFAGEQQQTATVDLFTGEDGQQYYQLEGFIYHYPSNEQVGPAPIAANTSQMKQEGSQPQASEANGGGEGEMQRIILNSGDEGFLFQGHTYDIQGNLIGPATGQEQLVASAPQGQWYPPEFYQGQPETGRANVETGSNAAINMQPAAAEQKMMYQQQPGASQEMTVMGPAGQQPMILVGPDGQQLQQVTTTAGVEGGVKRTSDPGGDYEPKSFGWWADICTDMALSLGFKLYFSYLLYTAFILTVWTGYDWLFATNYRMFTPPDSSRSSFAQTAAFFCIFFSLSFCLVAQLCMLFDMMRDFWKATKQDTRLWGMGWYERKPPWMVHGFLVIMFFPVPLLWAFIQTVSKGQSAIYMIQFFFYILTIITCWFVILMYMWFFMRAIQQKSRALARRHEDPVEGNKANAGINETQDTYDEEGNRTTFGRHGKYLSWYHSKIILQEYGLDAKSITWMIVVFVVALIPLFVINVVLATDGRGTNWNAGWTAIGVIIFCVLMLLREGTNSKHKGKAAVSCVVLIIIYLIFAIIGCGASASGGLFGVFVATFILSQALLLRKRNTELTKREVAAVLGVEYVDKTKEDKALDTSKFDTYLCCCKNTLFSCCRCCVDVRSVFGYKHPKILEEEKAIRKKRMALRTDQRVLMWYWLGFSACLMGLLIFGRDTYHAFGSTIAQRVGDGTPILQQRSDRPAFCELTFNPNGDMPFSVYDFALLSALGYSYGESYQTDFQTWFGSISSRIIKVDPQDYPQDITAASAPAYGRIDVPWTDYVDSQSRFHVIVVRGLHKASNYMRDIDMWGDSMAFQAAAGFAPHMMIWPEHAKREFVHGLSYVKRVYQGNSALKPLYNYIAQLQFAEPGAQIVLTGHGWNGGYAKIVADMLNIKSVTFNSPGTAWMRRFTGIHTTFTPDPQDKIDIQVNKNFLGYIDDTRLGGTVSYLPCGHKSDSHQNCLSVEYAVNSVLKGCGDSHGRSLRGMTFS